MTEKSEKLRYAKTSALLFTIVFMAYYYYGLRAVLVAAVSVVASVAADYVCCSAMHKKFDWTDESPLMSGLLLALLMPASVPYTVMAFAAVFMTVICKHAFGGNSNLIFCPVCTAYIFALLCFPSYIVRYPVPQPFGSVPLGNIVSENLTHSYTYYLDDGTASAFSLLDLVWGKLAGPMGSSAVLIILICAVALYFFRDIPTVAFFSGLAANVFISVLFPVGETGWYAVLNSLAAGSFLFVFVFMACDPRYVPKRAFSQLIYGVIFAAGAFIIRRNTTIENGAVFMMPLICVFRDEFDRLTDSLERLMKFLWKWIKIIARAVAKYTVIFSKWLWKELKLGAAAFSKLLDRLSDFIVKKMKERESKKQEKSEAAPEEEKPEGEVSDQEESSPAETKEKEEGRNE